MIHVADGDTITVLTEDKRQVRVRLWGIDAPESGQPYGRQATAYARELAAGQTVRIEEMDTDRWGRTVALVHLPDGQTLNGAMIRAGLAWVFLRYCNRPKICIPWAHGQETAKESPLGLWTEKHPTPPWEWRRK
ncbi:thermonuclease family protein [Desulfonatronum thiosulfatophilum]|uniref:thermonuclease family protein n=1 Tax=Desulfonatronum thiosulfatophilum TaxID=617002 RepID=UPI00137B57F3|nr:thermonuclease family protein [Desulfonatronum thiosulfatophilum]